VFWGLIAMLLGVVVATQLVFWQGNLASWLSFGRLRPLHTNAAIFAFVGNMMFAGSTTHAAPPQGAHGLRPPLPDQFLGWQLIIVSAALSLPLGLTQGKEYAELIWPWTSSSRGVVVFAVNFFWTWPYPQRKEPLLASGSTSPPSSPSPCSTS